MSEVESTGRSGARQRAWRRSPVTQSGGGSVQPAGDTRADNPVRTLTCLAVEDLNALASHLETLVLIGSAYVAAERAMRE